LRNDQPKIKEEKTDNFTWQIVITGRIFFSHSQHVDKAGRHIFDLGHLIIISKGIWVHPRKSCFSKTHYGFVIAIMHPTGKTPVNVVINKNQLTALTEDALVPM
jgi:hypothetical protein